MLQPVGAAFGSAAAHYAYELDAPGPGSVNATLVADTDRGWFRWSVSGIALTNATRLFAQPGYPRMDYTIAASPVLAVTFAQPTVVHHAWVVSAQAKPCEVPAYDASSDTAPAESAGAPSPLYPAVGAARGDPPFAQTRCDDEFARGTMIGPAAPLSLELGSSKPPRDGYAAAAGIALAPDGRVIDAWIYASSGSAAFDQAVLQSVKQAQYSGSISYCRPVSQIQTFTAAYKPR